MRVTPYLQARPTALLKHPRARWESTLYRAFSPFVIPSSMRPTSGSCRDGTNRPYRCKIRAPGFAHLAGADFMMRRESRSIPYPCNQRRLTKPFSLSFRRKHRLHYHPEYPIDRRPIIFSTCSQTLWPSLERWISYLGERLVFMHPTRCAHEVPPTLVRLIGRAAYTHLSLGFLTSLNTITPSTCVPQPRTLTWSSARRNVPEASSYDD